jgi:hypothetical protein
VTIVFCVVVGGCRLSVGEGGEGEGEGEGRGEGKVSDDVEQKRCSAAVLDLLMSNCLGHSSMHVYDVASGLFGPTLTFNQCLFHVDLFEFELTLFQPLPAVSVNI